MARAQRFVLVGDERQLPPYIDREVLREDVLEPRHLTVEELREPFFVHLAAGLPDANVKELTFQHRMNPAIGRLVSDWNSTNAACAPLPRRRRRRRAWRRSHLDP